MGLATAQPLSGMETVEKIIWDDDVVPFRGHNPVGLNSLEAQPQTPYFIF